MFVDKVEIVVKAGNGGSGLASFRREKFLPFGGPDGGDGGRGGNVFMEASVDLKDLISFKHRLIYRAENGRTGGRNRMHGVNGVDLCLKVPVGTTACIKKDGEIVQKVDFRKDGQRIMIARGGKGGKGNVHFATATHKAPREFQSGEEGEEYDVELEILLPVDVGIVGMPNSGKSSLLSALSEARPQIADFYFTTREPVLGTVDDGRNSFVWAEMPAVIKDSNKGKGLGTGFLRHLSRVNVIVYLLDACSVQIEDDLVCLKQEVEGYNPEFAGRKYVVAINKIDQISDISVLSGMINRLGSQGITSFLISAQERSGLKELVETVHKMVVENAIRQREEPVPEIIFRPRPVDKKE